MLAIISPAKKQNFSKLSKTGISYSQPIMQQEISTLISSLIKLNQDDIKKLMKVSDNIAKLNFERFQNFDTNNYNINNAKASVFALEGDVYKNLDPKSLTDKQINYMQDNLGILSGLYGYLRPLDLMQPYRLEMKTKLKTSNAENLYDFWGDKITDHIINIIKKNNHKYLINLASSEYFSSLNFEKIEAQKNCRVLNIIFKENKNNTQKIIGVMAKRARGLMARFIIENQIKSLENLKKFNLANYKFQANISNDSDLIFIANRD